MTKLTQKIALTSWLLIMSTDCHVAGRRQTRLGKTRTLFEYQDSFLTEYMNGAPDTRAFDDDIYFRKHSTGRSCKSGKGSGKGNPTCAPSSSPTAAPTVSTAPSFLPSSSPSRRPSATPSASPSTPPSISSAPSYAPSNAPSKSPTDRPSTLPSLGPTQSVMPSGMPTDRPSSKPSPSPTDSPSQSPSMVPSQVPSLRPSDRPSLSPTKSSMPSKKPSAAPSIPPSGAPSSTPSVSNVPTEILFATTSSDGFESVCENTLPAGGTTQEQTLAFKYNLYITPLANAADVTLTMETFLHFGMARNFLTCNFGASSNYYIVSIRSNPEDAVSADPCNIVNDPIPEVGDYECVVVNAQLSMTAYFPSTRRLQNTNANPDVLAASADYLGDSMERGDFDGGAIVQVSFQGFVNVQEQGNESPPVTGTDGGVAGIIGGQPLQPKNDNSSIAAGSTVIGIAAVCLVIVTIFSVRFRNGRREAYLKHFDELSEVSDLSLGEKRTDPLSWDGKVILVTDEDYDMDSSEDEEAMAEHDVRNCASATCQVCRNRELQPTFISTAFGPEAIADLRLRASRPTVSSRRESHVTPDTVVL